MTPNLVKNFVLLCLSALIALVLGLAISIQNYDLIVLPVILALGVATIVLPGYGFLIAFGLTCPFVLPLPLIWGMPTLLLVLGLCGLKFVLRRALGNERLTINYCLPVALFFGWVLVRYCMNPVTPGIAVGMSEGITGFRSYLSYAICAGVFFAIGLLRTEQQITNLLRWMWKLSLCFICIFIPLIFTKSLAVANVLQMLGIFTDFFENGWLRFIILPDFGLVLVCAGLLPKLFGLGRKASVALFLIGIAAIVFGGSRSAAGMLFVVLAIAAFFRYRWIGLAVMTTGIAVCLGTLYYIGETASGNYPALYRIASMVSPRAAEATGSAATIEWRKVRWERAMEDIREHPLVGMSYGGLENAFVFANRYDYENASVDIDVATGGIHNGYLAAARALGVPCALLFVYILVSSSIRAAKKAVKYTKEDAIRAELQAFICMNLATMALSMYIGTDVNSSRLWFLLGLAYWQPYAGFARRQVHSAAELPVAAVPA